MILIYSTSVVNQVEHHLHSGPHGVTHHALIMEYQENDIYIYVELCFIKQKGAEEAEFEQV